MDLELLKALGPFGGVGILAWVMWKISNRYMDEHRSQVKVTYDVMVSRIDALEKGHQQCEAERQRLADLFIDELRRGSRATKIADMTVKAARDKDETENPGN